MRPCINIISSSGRFFNSRGVFNWKFTKNSFKTLLQIPLQLFHAVCFTWNIRRGTKRADNIWKCYGFAKDNPSVSCADSSLYTREPWFAINRKLKRHTVKEHQFDNVFRVKWECRKLLSELQSQQHNLPSSQEKFTRSVAEGVCDILKSNLTLSHTGTPSVAYCNSFLAK